MKYSTLYLEFDWGDHVCDCGNADPDQFEISTIINNDFNFKIEGKCIMRSELVKCMICNKIYKFTLTSSVKVVKK